MTMETKQRHCLKCGYDLRGLLDNNRCPECGLIFDPHRLPDADFPWLRREYTGTFTAYWSTVWMVLTRWRHFARHANATFDTAQVDGFRRIARLIGTISIVALFELTLTPQTHPIEIALVALPSSWIFFAIITMTPDAIDLRPGGDSFSDAYPLCSANLSLTPVLPVIGFLYRTGLIDATAMTILCVLTGIGIALLGWCTSFAYVLVGKRMNGRALRFYILGMPSLWFVAALIAWLVAAVCAVIADRLV
jgi:hypothetical protein